MTDEAAERAAQEWVNNKVLETQFSEYYDDRNYLQIQRLAKDLFLAGAAYGRKAERERMLDIAWQVAEEQGGCCTNGDRFVTTLKQKLSQSDGEAISEL